MAEPKPARTAPTKHWVGIRGVTQEGQQYESTLEGDFLTLLRFDPQVKTYRTQPCRVGFTSNGKPHLYTPDVLVEYLDHLGRPPELIEVKPAKFAETPEPQLQERFDAAATFAEQRGWLFRVVTEEDIPVGRLKNARFLLRYRDRMPDEAFATLALTVLAEAESASLSALIQMCQQHYENRAKLLTELWTLIATRKVGADLDSELTMNSMIWDIHSCELTP